MRAVARGIGRPTLTGVRAQTPLVLDDLVDFLAEPVRPPQPLRRNATHYSGATQLIIAVQRTRSDACVARTAMPSAPDTNTQHDPQQTTCAA